MISQHSTTAPQPTAAEARAALEAAEQARTSVSSASAMPMAAVLLSVGSALTAAVVTAVAHAALNDTLFFILGMVVSLGLMLPGFVIYLMTARSWARGDLGTLVGVLAVQLIGGLGGIIAAANFGADIAAFVGAGIVIAATTAAMIILGRRA